MQANLTHLTDLTAELRRQPLGRQAEIARKAQAVQTELRDARPDRRRRPRHAAGRDQPRGGVPGTGPARRRAGRSRRRRWRGKRQQELETARSPRRAPGASQAAL
ncbi:hypothetical protein HBB16_08870 [Pseudonocardia sp. MCCB 268]|nr:hypothetical protein [Pseudonocardia cytotoxica]